MLYIRKFGYDFMSFIDASIQNAASLGSYIAGNWKSLIFDTFNAIATAWANLFSGKPLMEGLQRTAEALPTLIKPGLMDISQELQALNDEIGAKAEARRKRIHDATSAGAPAKATPRDLTTNRVIEFNAASMGGAEWAMKMRTSIMGSSTTVADKQLTVQERIAKSAEQTAENTRRSMRQGATLQ